MERVTDEFLQAKVRTINQILGQEPEPIEDGIWHVGTYVLGNYGLERVSNDGGGTGVVIHWGSNTPKRIKSMMLSAFIAGLDERGRISRETDYTKCEDTAGWFQAD